MDALVDSLLQLLQSKRSVDNCARLAAQDKHLVAFDHDIAAVQEAYTKLSDSFATTLMQLRTRRNESALICGLPNEILQQIFRETTGCGKDYRSNLAIASTCSFWRTAALGDPELWSCITLDRKQDPMLTTLFLERSRNQPLTLLRVSDNLPDNHGPLLSQILARARSVSTSKPSIDVSSHPTPHLEALELRRPPESFFYHVYPQVSIHSRTKLRELTLRDCCLAFKPGNYVGLRTLKITMKFRPNSKHTNLLVIFRESPLLEDLSLEVSPAFSLGLKGASHGLPIFPPSRKIRMNSLRSLKLSMFAFELADILSAIDFSAAIQSVDITVEPSASSESMGAFPHHLFTSQCLPTALVERLRSLSVFRLDSGSWELVGKGSHEDARRMWTLVITWTHWTTSNFILDSIVAHYPLSSVTSLTIATHRSFDFPIYAVVLAHCRSITHLSIQISASTGGSGSSSNMDIFCNALARHTALHEHLPPLVSIRFTSSPVRGDSSTQMPPVFLFQSTLQGLPDKRVENIPRFIPSRQVWLRNPLGVLCTGTTTFCGLFSNTLKHLEFDSLPLDPDSSYTASECMAAFVQAIRDVGPDLRVRATGLYVVERDAQGNLKPADRPCFPRDVWPANEPFTWTCYKQASHDGQTEYCEGCGWTPAARLSPSEAVAEPDDGPGTDVMEDSVAI